MPLTPLQTAFSPERMSRYLQWANGDPMVAHRLYTLNAMYSEALYIPLQSLELALRNRVHYVMSRHFGEGWLLADSAGLLEPQQEKIRKTLAQLRQDRKAPTPGQVVSTLSFGFWTALLGTKYDHLWRQALHRIVLLPNGKSPPRKSLAGPLTEIRKLRNRIAHHEPIVHYNLPRHHGNIRQIIGWLSPEAEQWCAGCDRFPALYRENPVHLLLAA